MRLANRARAIAPSLTLVVLTCVAYANSLRGEFVFDDLLHIENNPLIRNLSAYASPARFDAIAADPIHRHTLQARPLAYLSFALNYRLHGLDVLGYHLVNLLIHLAAGLLLYRLLRTTLALPVFERSTLQPRRTGVALFAAGCFLVHPIQTQAVSYTVQRMASMAGMFCLLSLSCYVEARTSAGGPRRWALYGLSVVALVAAMAAKEGAATFPLVLLLYELTFLAGDWRRRLAGLVPHLACLAIVPWRLLATAGSTAKAVALASAVAAPTIRPEDQLSRFDYFFTQLPVIMGYLRLIFWPAGQSVDHDPAVFRSLWNAPVLFSFAVLIAIATWAVWSIFRPQSSDTAWRLAGFGVLWFFLTMAVESSFIPITDLMVEHRLYLPLAGVVIAVTTAITLAGARWRWPQLSVRLAAGAILVALTAATIERNHVWQTPATLWTDTLSKSPNKSRPLNNVGGVRELEGRVDDAIELYRRAVAADGRNFEARFNLGNALAKRNRLAEAAEALIAALELVPGSARARERLIDVLTLAASQGTGHPSSVATETTLEETSLLRADGRIAESIATAEKLLARNSADPRIWRLLGELYLEAGWPSPAARSLTVAFRRQPNDIASQLSLAEALDRLGRRREAAALRRRADALGRTEASAQVP